MEKLKRYGLWCVVFLLLFQSMSMIITQQEVEAADSFDIDAESAILMEAESGQVIFEKNGDEALPPASMSKMMTEYLVLEAIEEGQFNWDTTVEISEYAGYLGQLDGTSRVFLLTGEEWTVEELYIAMAVDSSNDATVALAELVSGSEASFVEMMNQKAGDMGMNETRFVNSTGLPNRMLGDYIPYGDPEEENSMSARDTALLARHLINDYPKILDFSTIEQDVDTFPIEIVNRNWMLSNHPHQQDIHGYDGVDGLKTGHTEQAMYCFTGTAEIDGTRYISVVMRSESEDSRFRETKELLDYAFNEFEYTQIASEGDPVDEFATLPVAEGKEEEVAVALGDSIYALVHEDDSEDAYSFEYKPNPDLLNEEGEVMAPIHTGDVMGHMELIYVGPIEYGHIEGAGSFTSEIALVAQEDIEKAGWFSLFFRSIGDWFSRMWDRLADGVKDWFS